MILDKALLMCSDMGPKLAGIIFTNKNVGGAYTMNVSMTYEAKNGSQKTASISVPSGQSRDCSSIEDAVRPIRAVVNVEPGYIDGATSNGTGVSGISGSSSAWERTVTFNSNPPWKCEIIISVEATSG